VIVMVAHWETTVTIGGLSGRVIINTDNGLSVCVANRMGDGVSGDSVRNGVRYGAGGLVLYGLGGGGRTFAPMHGHVHQKRCKSQARHYIYYSWRPGNLSISSMVIKETI
jgi:hypothetical protein